MFGHRKDIEYLSQSIYIIQIIILMISNVLKLLQLTLEKFSGAVHFDFFI